MPDAPPGGDYKHASVGREACKKACPKHEGKAETGVLDAGFYGESTAVTERHFADGPHCETNPKGKEVMDEHHQEDVLHAEEERIYVA